MNYDGGRRRRPSQRQVLVRRVLALALLIGGLAAIVATRAKPTTTPRKAAIRLPRLLR